MNSAIPSLYKLGVISEEKNESVTASEAQASLKEQLVSLPPVQRSTIKSEMPQSEQMGLYVSKIDSYSSGSSIADEKAGPNGKAPLSYAEMPVDELPV